MPSTPSTQETILEPKQIHVIGRQNTSKRRIKKAIKLIVYLSLSVFAACTSLTTSYVTASFFAKSQWKQLPTLGLLTLIGILLLIALEFFAKVLTRLLDKLDKKLERRADALANWIVNQLENFLVKLRWQLNSPRFQHHYYKSLNDIHQDFETEGFRIGLTVVDLEKVFVQLQVAPEIPENISGRLIQANNTTASYKIWDILAEIPQDENYRRRHIAVIAPPGSGKTTLLKHVTLVYANNKQHLQHRQAPKLIPVLLYLRQIRNEITSEQPLNLPTLIRDQIRNSSSDYKINLPPDWFEEQLQHGRCLVMLDGLDEVANATQRQEVSKWVIAQMRAYRKNTFILTSRPHGYPEAQVEEVGRVFTVRSFNRSQIEQFIHSWYLQTEIAHRNGRNDPGVRSFAKRNADDLVERIKNSPPIETMAKNPLLLTMIATVHYIGSALPGRRVELYEKICDVLLGQRQQAKKISDVLTPRQKKSVLQVLALELMRKNTVEFKPNLGISIIKEKLEAVTSEVTPEQFLLQIETINGLLIQIGVGVYSFAHKSFQEYLAAVQIKESNEEQLLIENFYDETWGETIRLYAAQSDATNLVSEALKNPTVYTLQLAHAFLEEGAEITKNLREDLQKILEDGLESPVPQIAELAAQVRLYRRLTRLLLSDEDVVIDSSYITCAEYQLFVDNKLKVAENYQPAHWTNQRFASGCSNEPITGVSASGAEAFCEWLTQKYPRSGCRYRLPNLTEAEVEHPVTEKLVGSWCQDGDKKVIANIEPTQWQIWQKNLANACASDLAIVRELDSAIDNAIASDLAVALTGVGILNRAVTLPPSRTLALNRVATLKFDLTVILDCIITPARNRAKELELTITKTLKRAEERVCAISKPQLTSELATAVKCENTAFENHRVAEAFVSQINEAFKPVQERVYKCREDYSEAIKVEKDLEQDLERKEKFECELAKARLRVESLKESLKRQQNEACQPENLLPDEPFEHQLAEACKRLESLEKQRYLYENYSLNNFERELTQTREIAEDLKRKLDQDRQRAEPLQQRLDKARQRAESLNRQLEEACQHRKFLERQLTDIKALQDKLAHIRSIGTLRSYLLFISVLLDSLSGSEYAAKRDEILKLYALFVLIDERQAGRMPAWEGIQIVREQVQE